MSEFYLDTELEKDDLMRIKKIFDSSGFTIGELKDINFYEVAPVVGANLFGVAGVWSGFDEKWLIEKINKLKIVKNTKPNFFSKMHRWCAEQNTSRYWKQMYNQ